MKTLLASTLLFIISNTVLAASIADDTQSIQAARKAFNQAIAAHDIDSMRSFLAEDYVITISTGQIQRSRDAHIESFVAHFKEFPDVVYVRTPDEIKISQAYPLAIESGTWTGSRSTAAGALKNGGSYSAAWKKTEKGWLIYAELFVAIDCEGEGC
jgi:ketosteroid isomerase-like protein